MVSLLFVLLFLVSLWDADLHTPKIKTKGKQREREEREGGERLSQYLSVLAVHAVHEREREQEKEREREIESKRKR